MESNRKSKRKVLKVVRDKPLFNTGEERVMTPDELSKRISSSVDPTRSGQLKSYSGKFIEDSDLKTLTNSYYKQSS